MRCNSFASSWYPYLLLPDGVGVRNFATGDLLAQLAGAGGVNVLHRIGSDHLRAYTGTCAQGVNWFELSEYHESSLAAVLRYTLAYSHMYWADTRSMRFNCSKPVRGSWRRRAVQHAARIVGRVCSKPPLIKLIDSAHIRVVAGLPEVHQYQELFGRERPSILFCSHQRPPIILPPVLAARSLGIPTATFIFSWDNLTSKGRIAAPFDHYLVWSEHMKEDLLRYYPDVHPERVHVVGTPQFDCYADRRFLWTREEFCARVGADPKRPLICYSGGDTGTCPEDPEHLRILMRLARAQQLAGSPQVIVRPAPVDLGNRYDVVCRDYPELIFAKPAWAQTMPGDWSRVVPLPEDVQFLANLTQHADINVNVASTMTLDFAIHDKPVVNIAFDAGEKPAHGTPLWDFFYQFEHYRPVVELGAARFARSPEDLARHINDYLANPSLDREARRKLVDLQVGVPIGGSSARIVEVLQAISN
jgi:hypothetical protein